MRIKSVSYKEKERILVNALRRAKPLTTKTEFLGSVAAPFVGHYGYPKVNVGLLAPPEVDKDVWKYDAPTLWSKENYSIGRVVDFRSSMIKSTFMSNVNQMAKMVDLAQEVATAKNNVDIEVSLQKRPRLSIKTDQWVAPMGPSSKIKRLRLASNPKVPKKVQKFVDDTDALAVEALTTLFKKNIDETALTRMLSVGVFGKKRKLVPTRWSITAVDDTLGKDLLNKVRDFPVGDFKVHVGQYLGNWYVLLFFAQPWSYELFEMYASPNVLEYSTDFESYHGRKKYAQQCAGGYYTVRLALTEKLVEQKRQCSVLALRFITDDYVLPLGVWVTREATRTALANKPVKFASRELMLTYVKNICKKKFGVDVTPLLQRSLLLKQRPLQNWF